MPPPQIFLLVLLIFPECVFSQFVTNAAGTEITGGQRYGDLHLRASNDYGLIRDKMTDHITFDAVGGDRQATLDRKMEAIANFFRANQEEIDEARAVPKRIEHNNPVTKHGWRRNGRGELQVEVSPTFWPEIYAFANDQAGAGTRIFVNFLPVVVKNTQTIDYWYITHWGVFTLNGEHDGDIQNAVTTLRGELQVALDEALAEVQKEGSPTAGREKLYEALGHLNDLQLPELGDVVAGVRNALAAGAVQTYNLNYQDAPASTQNRLLGARPRVNRMDLPGFKTIIEEIKAAKKAAQPPPPPPPSRADIFKASPWARVNAHQKRTPGGGERKKRSDNPDKELSAKFNIVDADPSSDYVISKIEFKEIHGDKEETHFIDFERKAFIPDPNPSGSQLTAEFKVGNQFVPAEVEKSEVTTIKIVLKPRGN